MRIAEAPDALPGTAGGMKGRFDLSGLCARENTMPGIPRTAVVVFCIAVTAALAGCAGFESAGSGPAAEAPAYRVGDRWAYRAQDGFLTAEHWEETHAISALGADGIGARIAQKGPSRDIARAELWSAPGLVQIGAVFDNETRRFATPLERYRFPLAAGQSWSQFVDNYNETTKAPGQINRYVRVRGWEKVITPAGTFDALAMHVVMHLDDEEFWRFATQCNYTVWYAPAVRGVVREEKRAQYLQKNGDHDSGGLIRTQNAVVELLSFTPGS